ncbi:uncharacterized protein LOC135950432 [Calliphora vicina]|uniref:uncharacterized protein LOC135950432 n=1 Tax=Calliphora vicina TaxID=7373 RepID=UPI00325AA8DB
MVDNIGAAATSKTTTTYKCKLNVNNTRTTTKLQSYVNKYKSSYNYNNNKRRYFSKCTCCTHIWKSIRSSCHSSRKCSSDGNCCDCSCSRKKISLIVKNIVTLLLPQTTQIKTALAATKLAHATTTTTITSTTNRKYATNNDHKRKKVQLHLKQQQKMQHGQQQQQLKYLYALGKCVIKTKTIAQKQEQTENEAQTPTTQHQLQNPCSITTTATTSILSTPKAAAASPSYPTFSTILHNCKHLTASASSNSLNHSDSCSMPPSSSSSSAFSTWYSLTSRAPAFRILNELYGVIFMTLLVLSICHNNVLETSAASVKVSRRDVVASSAAAEQVIMPSSAAGRLNERHYKRQHPPEQISQQQLQQPLPQVHNHHQPQQSYSSREVEQLQHQQALENEMEEDKSNHIFQPQIQTESLPFYQQHERDQQQQQQHHQTKHHQQQRQHLTTQATSFSHGMALETTYNHTFQSLSIIDGDLTVAVATSQNLMAVEEEMLVAAAGGAVGVGSNAFGLGNHLHLHNNNNGLGSYDSAAMGLDGIDVLAHNTDTNSMPIFDYGMPRNITARTGHTEAIIKCRVARLDDKSVSWIRKRDLHILTVGTATYTSDKRFQVTESKDSREWTLHVKSPQARDSGIYECQVNTEPKISMAFQLNVIEISPDAKADITGPADLHFKVGSAIILTCIVHQPSIKDIGPIYWYRGEYMITPFDINDEAPALQMAGVTTPKPTAPNKVNVVEPNYEQQQKQNEGIYGGATDAEQIPQILTNEITPDFAQRIAMESQLGDTMKSRLRISNAQTSDTGNYTCQPTTASSASVMVHVINDESPAAMQKSGANSFHNKRTETLLMPLICATIVVAVAAATASILNLICGNEGVGEGGGGGADADDVGYCCWLSSTTTSLLVRTQTTKVIRRKSCIMLTCLRCHVISKNMLEGIIDLIRKQHQQQQQLLLLHNNLPPRKIHIHIATYNNNNNNNIQQLMQSDDYVVVYGANVVFVAVVVYRNCTSSASDAISCKAAATTCCISMSITDGDTAGAGCTVSCYCLGQTSETEISVTAKLNNQQQQHCRYHKHHRYHYQDNNSNILEHTHTEKFL